MSDENREDSERNQDEVDNIYENEEDEDQEEDTSYSSYNNDSESIVTVDHDMSDINVHVVEETDEESMMESRDMSELTTENHILFEMDDILLSNSENNVELFDLVENLSKEKNDELLSRLQGINDRQNKVLQILSQLSLDFERNIELIPTEIQRIDSFRSKLANVRLLMSKITERIQILQHRMNMIRASLPVNSTVLSERPLDHGIDPYFYYRCLVPTGLKYRTKPTVSASIIPGKEIKYHEIVAVKERVFICNESIIFLHIEGCGWLFENTDKVRYMERIGKSKTSHNFVDTDVLLHDNDKTNVSSTLMSPTKLEKLTYLDV